jgi:hypothetical protein
MDNARRTGEGKYSSVAVVGRSGGVFSESTILLATFRTEGYIAA